MTSAERPKNFMSLHREIADLQERMQSHMTIKREELFLAMRTNDSAKIEGARQAAVDTFAAFLDELIKAHHDVELLRPK